MSNSHQSAPGFSRTPDAALATKATGLCAREHEAPGYLRCQLSTTEIIPARRFQIGSDIIHVESEQIHRLIGYGPTWADAIGMVQGRLGTRPRSLKAVTQEAPATQEAFA